MTRPRLRVIKKEIQIQESVMGPQARKFFPLVTLFSVLAFVIGTSTSAFAADPLPLPQGPVLLTVDGTIEQMNKDGTAVFDLAMLKSFEPETFETSTIWTDGVQTYTGVSLKVFLDEIGAEGTEIRATAINDYTVSIPLSDAVDDGPIIAYETDGKPMTLRNKGPLWIIYPYDAKSEYRSEVIYSRSIWQLDRITVVP